MYNLNIINNIILFVISLLAIGFSILQFYRIYKLKKNIDKKSNQNIKAVNEIIEKTSPKEKSINTNNNTVDFSKLKTDIKYATECFTPILKRLRNDFGEPVFLSEYFAEPELSNWILFTISEELEYKEILSTLVYKNESFIFYNILNNNLIKNGKLTGIGKIAITHEFCHFIAYLINFAGMGKEALKNRTKEILTHKLNMLQSKELLNIYNILSNNTILNKDINQYYFPDSHFRLGFDNVKYNYNELFQELLFPVSEFKEYFDDRKYEQFLLLLREDRKKEAMDILFYCIKELSNKTDLPENFLNNYVRNYLPLLTKNI